MRIPHLVLVFTLLSLVFAGVAAAESGTVTIPIGRDSDVLSLALRSGETVDVTWSATGSVELRVERVGGTGIFSQVGQTGTAAVAIPLDSTYLFSFRNEGLSTVTVTWSINRRPDIVPWLIVGFAVVLIGVGVLAILRERRRRMGWANLPPQPPMPPSR